MRKLAFFAFAMGFFIWCLSVAFKGMGPGPDVVFDALLVGREQVRDVDGFVQKGDGYDVHIRFRAEGGWALRLRPLGFEAIDCEGVRTRINFSLMRVAIWPPWRPEELTDTRCFRRLGANKWSPRGRDLVLAETGGGWVYFAGEGPEHDRALPSSDGAEFPEDE